jgi:hypothetical protein
MPYGTGRFRASSSAAYASSARNSRVLVPSMRPGVPRGARRATTIAARALVTSWNSTRSGSDPTDAFAALEGGIGGSVSVGRGPASPTVTADIIDSTPPSGEGWSVYNIWVDQQGIAPLELPSWLHRRVSHRLNQGCLREDHRPARGDGVGEQVDQPLLNVG